MSTTMRALRIHDWDHAPTLDELPVPVVGSGETLVRIEAAAVTHLDLTIAGGMFSLRPELPYVGGVEGAGTVLQSSAFAPGTRVTVRGGTLGAGGQGTWADYLSVPDEFIEVVPDGLDAVLAATAFEPLTTAYVALDEVARLGRWPVSGVDAAHDEVVVVAGAAGAVGSCVAQLAVRAGARVIGLVSRAERVADLPAGVEPLTPDDSTIAQLSDLRPATLLVDTWGGQALLERGRWVRPGGRAAVIGYVQGTEARLDLPNWLFGDVSLLPVNLIERAGSARRCYPELRELLLRGELTVTTETFQMSEASEAVDRLRHGKVSGRAAITFTDH